MSALGQLALFTDHSPADRVPRGSCGLARLGNAATRKPPPQTTAPLHPRADAADSAGAVKQSPHHTPHHRTTRAALAAALLALPLVGGGCQSARLATAYTQADDFKAFVGVSHAADTLYRIASPDTLHITVLRGGQAVDHRVTLPPDGQLLLPGLAWPVDTTGLTPGEVAQDLEQAIRAADPTPPDTGDPTTLDSDSDPASALSVATGTPHENAPPTGPWANRPLTLDPVWGAQATRQQLDGGDPVHVAVRVDRFASRRVFVFGQVRDSGSQAWDGHNRLSSALAAAGPGHRADLHRVLVLRPGPDGDPRRRLIVAVQRLLDTGDNTLDVALAPGDIVFVPATGLGRLGLAVDRVRLQTDTEWIGNRPAPFFPTITRTEIFLAAAAPTPENENDNDNPSQSDDTPDAPALPAAHLLAITPPVTPTESAPPTDTAVDSLPPTRPAVSAVTFISPAAPHAVETGATEPLDTATDPLMQIRIDTAPQTPITDDAVHFWAP